MRRLALGIGAGVAAALFAFTLDRGSAGSPASATRPKAIVITTAGLTSVHEEARAKRIGSRPLTITDVRSSDPGESPHSSSDDSNADDALHDGHHEDDGFHHDLHHEDDDGFEHDDHDDADDSQHDDEDGGRDD